MGFVEKLKDLTGFGDVDYEDETEMEEEEEREEKAAKPKFATGKKSKVVPISGAEAQNNIVVLRPKCFDDSKKISAELKQRHPVIIDLGALDPEEARRVVDFVAGTIYGGDGDMKRVSGGVFLATPNHVSITGEVLKDDNGNGDMSMF